MIPHKYPPPQRRNIRRASSRKRDQNLLEVSVRSRLASQQRNQRILLWTCKLLLIIALVSGSIYGGKLALNRYFWENPKYAIAVVEIDNSGSGVTREMVLAASGLEVGKHIYSVSLDKARIALEELPQVQRVELRRVLPNKISIELTERRPVAWLADPDATDPTASEKSYLIDARGILFKAKRQVPEYLRLPVIYGAQPENYLPGERVTTPEIEAALELIALNDEFHTFEMASLDISKGYCVTVTNNRQRKYTFSLDGIRRQLERCGMALELAAKNQVEIDTINLMMERNVPVTYTRIQNEISTPAEARGSAKVEQPVVEEPAVSSLPPPPVKTAAPQRKSAAASSASTVKRAQISKPKTPSATPPVKRAEPVIRKAQPVKPGVPVAASVLR